MRDSEPAPPPPDDLAGWLPQDKVVRRLQVSRTTLWRWRAKYGLASATVGRRVFYSAEDIDALMRRSTAGAE